MNWKCLFAILMCIQTTHLWASEACSKAENLNDVLQCIKSKHNRVQLGESKLTAAKYLEDGLSKIPNPQLDAKSLKSKNGSQIEISLTQEIDLSGKRRALKNEGVLKYNSSLIELNLTKEEVVEAVLFKYQELKNNSSLVKIYSSSVKNIDLIIKTLKNRPVLSPEQEANLWNFEIQKNELQNSVALLNDQIEESLLFFELNGNYEGNEVLRLINKAYSPLNIKSDKKLESLNLANAKNNTELLKNAYEIEKKSVFEGFSIGPSFLNEKAGNEKENYFGLTVSMPIPLWQLNGANKAMTQVQMHRGLKEVEMLQKLEESQKRSIDKRIHNLVERASVLSNLDKIERNHEKVLKLYFQGSINSSILVESFRTLTEVYESKTRLEDQLLKLTIEKLKLNGSLLEVTI